MQLRTQINQKLEENGERERLIACKMLWKVIILIHDRLGELLRARLKECGWRDQLKENCRGRCYKLQGADNMLLIIILI